MRMPRDISGDELVRLLRRRYGYEVIRQRGSHMRLESNVMGIVHRVTVPNHRPLQVRTLNSILSDIGEYLGMSQSELRQSLFND